jgi:hypothetical protein
MSCVLDKKLVIIGTKTSISLDFHQCTVNMKRNLHHIEVFQNMYIILLYETRSPLNLVGELSHDSDGRFGRTIQVTTEKNNI